MARAFILILQPRDTMSLRTADLSSVCVRARTHLSSLKHNRATHYFTYANLCPGELNAIRKQKCFICMPFYGSAYRWAMLGEIKT